MDNKKLKDWQISMLLDEPNLDCYINNYGQLLIIKTECKNRLKVNQLIEIIEKHQNLMPILVKSNGTNNACYGDRLEVLICLNQRNYV